MHHIGVYPFRRHFNLSVCVSDEAAYRAIGVSYRKVNATASKSIPSLVASSSLNPTSSVKVSFDAKAAGSNSFTSFLGAGWLHLAYITRGVGWSKCLGSVEAGPTPLLHTQNFGYTPQRIGDAHLADKLAYLRWYSWSATTAPRLPAPIRSEAGAVPFYCGLRLHNRQYV